MKQEDEGAREVDDMCADLAYLVTGEMLGGKIAKAIMYMGGGAISMQMEDGSRWNVSVARASPVGLT